MINTILIVILIEIGIRILPLLDSLVELINHFIAVGVAKCDSDIRHIALKDEIEFENKNSLPVIGFVAPEEEEGDDFDED